MELYNLDIMLQEQKELLEKYKNLPIERVSLVEVNYEMPQVVITKTHMTTYKGELLLIRYIANKVVKVRFPEDVSAKAIEQYFNLPDGVFIKCSREVSHVG